MDRSILRHRLGLDRGNCVLYFGVLFQLLISVK